MNIFDIFYFLDLYFLNIQICKENVHVFWRHDLDYENI